MSDPYVDRPNVISRYKEKKFGRQYMLFGKDCDVDAASRSSGRTMFDGDLLIQGDLLVSSPVAKRVSRADRCRKTHWTILSSH
jgi:actin-related protein 5